MEIIKWIKRTWYKLIVWVILRDGHTTRHYFGNVTVWKDSHSNISIKEMIKSNKIHNKLKENIIYVYLKYKYNIKY